jgi:hypothetical protein
VTADQGALERSLTTVRCRLIGRLVEQARCRCLKRTTSSYPTALARGWLRATRHAAYRRHAVLTTVRLGIGSPCQARGDTFATKPPQLTDRADLDRLQRLDRFGRQPQRLDRQWIECIRLASERNRADRCILRWVRSTITTMITTMITTTITTTITTMTMTMTRECERGANGRSGCKLRPESAGSEGTRDTPHQRLLCSVDASEQGGAPREIAEKTTARSTMQVGCGR